MIDQYLGRKKNDKRDFYTSGNHDEERVKCPFLQHNICSIYPVRPFVCRNYMIIPDEAGICGMVRDGKEKVRFVSSPYIDCANDIIHSNYYSTKNSLWIQPIDLKKYYADLS